MLLDADTIVVQRIDDLFDRPGIAAAPDFFLPDQFNSGVFIFQFLHSHQRASARGCQSLPKALLARTVGQSREREGAGAAFQFVVALRGARPRVWRRVLVRGDMLLSELHGVLQAVTDVDADLHAFSLPGAHGRSRVRDSFVTDRDECCIRLADVAGAGTRLHYECIGDECWRYRLDVETVCPLEPDVGYPVCLAGRSACPGAYADFDLARINQRLATFQRLPAPRRSAAPPSARQCQRAREALAGILERLPLTVEELGRGLAGLSTRAIRRELVAMIDEPESFAARLLVVDAFVELGLGERVRELQAIAADTARPIAARGLAFEVLSLMEPTATASVLGTLTPRQREPLLEEQFGSLLVATQVEPDAAVLVAQTLADQVALGDQSFLAFLEACRELVGVPAAVAYGEALRSPALTPIRSRLLEILVAAGGSQVAGLLARARDETLDATWRSRLQRALVRVLTDTIRARQRTPAVAGRAWLTGCDSLGRFALFAHVEMPRASAFANVVASLDGGFRDAELVPRVSREEARLRLAAFVSTTGDRLVSVPLTEAAAHIALIARRTREQGLEVPRRTAVAVELLESAWDGALPPASAGSRTGPVDDEPVRALLERSHYMRAWRFDPASLDEPAAGGAFPGTAAWRRRALVRVGRSGFSDRLRSMCLFMRRWHELDGDHEAAALCSAMAEELERGASSSSLCRVLLDKVEDVSSTRAPLPVGDSALRDRLRTRFFATVDTARGTDLARLDFAEAARLALDAELVVFDLPPLPDDACDALADELGRLLSRMLSGRRVGQRTGDRLRARFMRLLGLDAERSAIVFDAVMASLAAFREHACNLCPVACLGRLSGDCTEAFRSKRHPLAQLPRKERQGRTQASPREHAPRRHP